MVFTSSLFGFSTSVFVLIM